MAENEEGCELWDLTCKGGEVVDELVGSQFEKIVQSWQDATVIMLKLVNTWWMEVPSPDVESQAISQIQGDMSWYTFGFALIGILFALGKMVLNQDFKTLTGAARPIVNLIIVTGAYAAGVAALLTAGDAFAKWILDRAAGVTEAGTDLSGLAVTGVVSHSVGTAMILYLLMLVGSVANLAFMVFRNAMVPIMLAILPTLAASTGTEMGNQAFKKANAWLAGLLLFKPVAAVIYALGLWMVKEPMATESMSDAGKVILQAAIALTVILMAALSLPALVRFLVPVAATGASGAFSGGAAVGSAVAAGAAVVAIGATAGTGAPAVAGGGSAAAGGGSAAGGGAATGGAAASQGAGGSGPPAGGAPRGGEGPSGGGAPSSPGGGDVDGSKAGTGTAEGAKAGSLGPTGGNDSSGSSAQGAGSGTSTGSASTPPSGGSTDTNQTGPGGAPAGDAGPAASPPGSAAPAAGKVSGAATAISNFTTAQGSQIERAAEDQ